MSELTERSRDDLQNSDFAYIDQQGGRHLPIHDESHVRNAAARFGQTDFESAEAKRKAAKHIVAASKRYGVHLGEDDDVTHAAK